MYSVIGHGPSTLNGLGSFVDFPEARLDLSGLLATPEFLKSLSLGERIFFDFDKTNNPSCIVLMITYWKIVFFLEA